MSQSFSNFYDSDSRSEYSSGSSQGYVMVHNQNKPLPILK